MAGAVRHPLCFLLTLAALLVLVSSSGACPFCSSQGKTLVEEMNDAEMVIYGAFTTHPAGYIDGQGPTDFKIDAIIKPHDALGKKMKGDSIALERDVGPTEKGKRWLVFCNSFKGKVDPYLGKVVDVECGIEKYLAEAVKYQDRTKDPAKRLRFFFGYLDNPEPEISNDALKEWSLADYKDYRDLAKELPAAKLVKWISDKNTPGVRIGLYASLLGHCGTAENASLLRSMLNDPAGLVYGGLDGVLAGYIFLQPTEGWKLAHEILGNTSNKFSVRYAVLRTARFFWDNRLDVVDKEKIVGGICQLLDQTDIADLAMEDLRKRSEWGPLERILALNMKPSHNVAIIRRSILRYALSVPPEKDPKGLAKAFVDSMRKANPERVKDAEELLRLEKDVKKQ